MKPDPGNQSINEIFVVRALAILAVIMVHSTSNPAAQIDGPSTSLAGYNFLNMFFKFGTPTFILLTSFILFYNYYQRPVDRGLVTRFYKRRLLYILIPYLFFSILYFELNQAVLRHGPETWSGAFYQFVGDLLTGSAHPHLYFVFISVQFYMIFPLFLKWMQKSRFTVVNALWIGLLIQWAFVFYNNMSLQYQEPASLAIWYAGYYFTGAFIGIYYHKVSDWLRVTKENFQTKRLFLWLGVWGFWLFGAGGHIYIYYLTRAYGMTFDSRIYTMFWNIHTITTAIILLQLSYWIYKHWPRPIVNTLIHLGIVSFGIYLLHPLVLHAYRMTADFNDPTSLVYHAWIAGGFLTALGLTWIIVTFVLKYMKGGWIFFGAWPKQNPFISKKDERSN
ncbi:surface polysaccharide O-acyltransferase-like enzyme [Salsuginibacillus halophilus]|uniref:Surface polysaccharide O-acyltransferase-like enzyme n=1 Tax=Salsuginibacillus halophilus TaxID=517424 RepID=A0A2P8HQD3_9BACI|nr:acyltransferase [Salsuginibacillus halophilus]PSL48418.1 surface polysaccharide O-acyltransferase-like enzyme [Salsuginibacillus halophilus]